MKLSIIAVGGCFLATFVWAADAPQGLDPIFKGVESGKKFHPLWPPVAGQSAVGIIIEAKNPKEPRAFFESIESPRFRSPNFNGLFEMGEVSYAPQIDLTKERTIDVKTAFAQLDAIASAIKSAGATDAKPAADTKPAADAKPAADTKPAADAKLSTSAGASASSTTKPSAAQGDIAARTDTGVDFSSFVDATVKVGGLKVKFYTIGTLQDIAKQRALSSDGFDLISDKNSKLWIIHRALSADTLEYNLTSKTDINAGFFAQLVKWLPTFSLRYKNNRTIVINSTSPLTIGYKLWRPDQQGFAGAAAEDVAMENLGIDDVEISKIFAQAK